VVYFDIPVHVLIVLKNLLCDKQNNNHLGFTFTLFGRQKNLIPTHTKYTIVDCVIKIKSGTFFDEQFVCIAKRSVA
jgi:hypothetical protein